MSVVALLCLPHGNHSAMSSSHASFDLSSSSEPYLIDHDNVIERTIKVMTHRVAYDAAPQHSLHRQLRIFDNITNRGGYVNETRQNSDPCQSPAQNNEVQVSSTGHSSFQTSTWPWECAGVMASELFGRMQRMFGQQLPLRRHRNDQHDILQVSHADYVDHSLCGQSGSNDHTASLIRVMEHRHSTHPGTSNNLHACASDPTCSYLAYSAHHAKAIAFHGFPREHNFGKLASFSKIFLDYPSPPAITTGEDPSCSL